MSGVALTQERLRSILRYDLKTGWFTRIANSRRTDLIGKRAGSRAKRGNVVYRVISIDCVSYYEHQLAWLYVYGEWLDEIDHWDNDGEHNAIDNLRKCTSTQNKGNSRKPKNNVSGFKGVCWANREQKWRATVNFNRKQYYLGMFDDPASAHAAYIAKAQELFGEFARAA